MRLFLAAVLAVLPLTAAAETDVATTYDVSTEGTTTRLKAGETGKLVISITPKNGAHVSDEAPLKIELSSKHSKLSREKLTLADAEKASLEKKMPRFEVPFTPNTQGPTTVEAKMTFFICTEKLCSRQTRNLSLAVEVM